MTPDERQALAGTADAVDALTARVERLEAVVGACAAGEEPEADPFHATFGRYRERVRTHAARDEAAAEEASR